uniref:Uncharacterized protein n=1 Tax=Candidatus Nitrotoga fabula TaxID=2182327 RepID=A0A2X0SIG4_9PROT|nr:protein of unknown function [Candidatus Nitrotoga fabula]
MFTTKNTALLAPYGSMKHIALASKVGKGKVDSPLLAPYGSARFMPLATKIGGGKHTITQASNGEGKGFGISTVTDPGKIPSARG